MNRVSLHPIVTKLWWVKSWLWFQDVHQNQTMCWAIVWNGQIWTMTMWLMDGTSMVPNQLKCFKHKNVLLMVLNNSMVGINVLPLEMEQPSFRKAHLLVLLLLRVVKVVTMLRKQVVVEKLKLGLMRWVDKSTHQGEDTMLSSTTLRPTLTELKHLIRTAARIRWKIWASSLIAPLMVSMFS